MKRCLGIFVAALVLVGCKTTRPGGSEGEPVVDPFGTLEFLEPGLRPEEIFFPRYLFLADFRMERHGRVPEGTLVGAGMRARLGLAEARKRFNDVLKANGWVIDKLEVEPGAFRIIATQKEGVVELRGVQGRGEAMVFLLYEPDPADVEKVF